MVRAARDEPTSDDLGQLNDAGELTNSWARWAPFEQKYKEPSWSGSHSPRRGTTV